MNQPEKSGFSMMAGFGFGWLTLIVAPAISWIAVIVAGDVFSSSSIFASLLLQFLMTFPLLAVALLGVGFLIKGHKRAALGVVAAAGSAVALILLLVAACFGLLSVSH